MADFVLNDRVKETTTSTGTGTIQLAGAETGFDTFVAGVGNGKETFYSIDEKYFEIQERIENSKNNYGVFSKTIF